MKYLVMGSNGPTGTTPEDMIEILEDIVLPGLDALMRLESENTVLAGGVPVSERGVVFIVDAPSNEELDQLLRNLPLWEILEWQVTPLQTFEGRAFQERRMVQQLKKR
ncbi:MAG: muconolactone Delta-isomerase family protein [Syntrophorhabdales bacterium]